MTHSALLTGVSRRIGIAWTLAEHRQGWALSTSGWPAHDQEQTMGRGRVSSGYRWLELAPG